MITRPNLVGSLNEECNRGTWPRESTPRPIAWSSKLSITQAILVGYNSQLLQHLVGVIWVNGFKFM
jgi:hypothetical protein